MGRVMRVRLATMPTGTINATHASATATTITTSHIALLVGCAMDGIACPIAIVCCVRVRRGNRGIMARVYA
jgi:hypothetical protein